MMNSYPSRFRFSLAVTFLDTNGTTKRYHYQWTDSDLLSPQKTARAIARDGLLLSDDPDRLPAVPFVLIPPHRILTISLSDEPPTPVAESPAARAARPD